MADPRGHGFNRGRGKWHAPVYRQPLPTLGDFGWEFSGFAEPYPTARYTQAEYELTQQTVGLRTKTTVTNTITGRTWQFQTTDPAEITAAIFGEGHLLATAESGPGGYYGVGR
jgi:hypothetical protein